jgi:hypothetical protein
LRRRRRRAGDERSECPCREGSSRALGRSLGAGAGQTLCSKGDAVPVIPSCHEGQSTSSACQATGPSVPRPSCWRVVRRLGIASVPQREPNARTNLERGAVQAVDTILMWGRFRSEQRRSRDYIWIRSKSKQFPEKRDGGGSSARADCLRHVTDGGTPFIVDARSLGKRLFARQLLPEKNLWWATAHRAPRTGLPLPGSQDVVYNWCQWDGPSDRRLGPTDEPSG